VAVPEVARPTYHKFALEVPLAVNRYVFAQYLVILVGTAAFLFGQHSLSLGLKALGALWIGAGILAGGGLFEQKRWAYALEGARLLGSLPLVGYVLLTTPATLPFHLPAFAGLTVWGLGSLAWLGQVWQASRRAAAPPAAETV
jgi:hypothetical protein